MSVPPPHPIVSAQHLPQDVPTHHPGLDPFDAHVRASEIHHNEVQPLPMSQPEQHPPKVVLPYGYKFEQVIFIDLNGGDDAGDGSVESPGTSRILSLLGHPNDEEGSL